MQETMIARAAALLADGTVNRVLGWKKGEFVYDITPAVFTSEEELKSDFVYDDFCGNNLSKYLIKESRKEGKVLAFLKPCDTYSFNQLIKEHRILRDNVYIVGIPCDGKISTEKMKAAAEGIVDVQVDGETLHVDTLYGQKMSAVQTYWQNAAYPAKVKSMLPMTN